MKIVYRQLFIMGLLSMALLGSCADDDNSPTDSSVDIVIIPEETPSPSREFSDVVVLVDKNHADAESAPCGTEGSVCGSLTDGLFSAAMFQDGVPTVLVRSGIYDEEPTYPIHIHVPVRLKAEHAHEAVIASAQYGTFVIAASDVVLEGLKIISHGWKIVEVIKEGYATLNNLHMEIDIPPTSCSYSVLVQEEAATVIRDSQLHSVIGSYGNLTMTDSMLSQTYGCSVHLLIWDGQAIVENNTFYSRDDDSRLDAYSGSEVEFKGNIVYGGAGIFGGKANLDGNTFATGVGIRKATVSLNDNLIQDGGAGNSEAFWVEDSTVFISNNRFDSELDGTRIITCDEGTSLKTDGTNTLLNPSCWIACDELPQIPRGEPF